MEKQFKSVIAHYDELISKEVVVDKLQQVKDLAAELLTQVDLSGAVGILHTIQEFLKDEEESAKDRLERFKKAKIGQILNSTRVQTPYGLLMVKRHKVSPDGMALSIQLKRDNGMLVTLETHDELEHSFESACARIKGYAEEGTLGDYVIQAYESVVSL